MNKAMRLLIIRHGDPDYSVDSLTPKGFREAGLLACRLAAIDNVEYFCSPLGRARDTAAATLKLVGERTGRQPQARTLEWMHEFESTTHDPRTGEERVVAWDMHPSYWTEREGFYHREAWSRTDYLDDTDTEEEYLRVCAGLDELLGEHGYRREGAFYRAQRANDATLMLFCHFGVQAAMLGHLLGISPYLLWHGALALPSSVTTLVTEEREQGIAYFRCLGFGDLSHLYANGEPPAFSGRYCELFTNADERH